MQETPQPPAEAGFLSNVNKGIGQEADQTFATIEKGVRKIPGVGDFLAKHAGLDDTIAHDTANAGSSTGTAGETVGHGVETVGEFLMGEEALKGFTYAEKLTKIAPVLKQIEKFPRLAQALATGIKQGVVGTAQGLAKGESVGDALATGAVTGATGAAAEGATSAVKGAARTTAEIAGEKIPALARQVPKAGEEASTVAKIGPGKEIPEKLAKQQQAGAARVVQNMAHGSAERAVDKLNEIAQPKTLNSPEALERGTVEAAQKPAEGTVQSFGDAADHVRQQVKPIYDKLNEATGGEFKDLQAARGAAYRSGDYNAMNEADQKIGDLLEKNSDKVSPAEYQAAKQGWQDAKVLDQVHAAVEGSWNNIASDVAKKTGADRTLSGKKLLARLSNVTQKLGTDKVDAVLGPEGRENLTRIGYLLDDPQKAAAAKSILEQVGFHGHHLGLYSGIGLAGAGVGAAHAMATGESPWKGAGEGAAATVTAAMSAKAALHLITTNSTAGKMLDWAVNHHVAAKVAAPLIAATLQGVRNNDQQPSGDQEQ
jgi:hypothetical protein